MRGFLEDLDFRRWILRLTGARRDVLDVDALLDSARYGIEEGLRAGITTYADTCDSGVVMRAMRDAGVRGVMYQEVFGPDPAQCEASIAGLREKVAGLRYLETPLVRVGVSPHAPYTVSDDLFRATTALAREHGLPMAIHVAESEREHALSQTATARSPTVCARRGIHVAASRPVADRNARPTRRARRAAAAHSLRARRRARHRRIAERDAPSRTVRCRTPSWATASRRSSSFSPPASPWDLARDSMASNNRMDLLEEARIALLVAARAARIVRDAIGGRRARTGDPRRRSGARPGVTWSGSLEEGKQADLAAFPLDRVGPDDSIRSTAAVFALGGAQRRSSWLWPGKPLVSGRTAHRSPRGLAATACRSWAMRSVRLADAGGETRP